MDELDLLKKNWNKNSEEDSKKFSATDIYKMLQSKSTSTVKWIFIVSIIELVLGILLNISLSFTKYEQENIIQLKEWGIYPIYMGAMAIMYVIIIYFIFQFLMVYKKVSIADNTKTLLQNIVSTQTIVKRYIAFNLITFVALSISFGLYVLYKTHYIPTIQSGLTPNPLKIILIVIILILVTLIFAGLVWGIYKLIYGYLSKRLLRNYEDIKRSDIE